MISPSPISQTLGTVILILLDMVTALLILRIMGKIRGLGRGQEKPSMSESTNIRNTKPHGVLQRSRESRNSPQRNTISPGESLKLKG